MDIEKEEEIVVQNDEEKSQSNSTGINDSHNGNNDSSTRDVCNGYVNGYCLQRNPTNAFTNEPIDPRSLFQEINDLERMSINELISKQVEPIKEIQQAFSTWYNRTNDKQSEFNIKFNINDNLNYTILPRDLLVLELREPNDLYDSYVGAYQHLAKYNKDVIDKQIAPIGKLAIQLDWYKKACNLLFSTNLNVMNTLTLDYSYTIVNGLNNQTYTNRTKFLLYYYPVGLFESNNILPTQVINRLIFRYRFIDRPICFIPSITNSFSNTNDFAVKVNDEFNKLLFCIIKFVERNNDKIIGEDDMELKTFTVTSTVKHKPYKIDMKIKANGSKISIFNMNLLPNVVQYNSYYNDSFSPILVDVNKYKTLIDEIEKDFKSRLADYGYSKEILKTSLKSLVNPTSFNIAIIWFFINSSIDYKEKSSFFMPLRENIQRVFDPETELEKNYYKTKIRLVSDNKLTFSTMAANDLVEFNDDERITKYYTFNEMIHLINLLIMIKDDHFYFKYQKYSDISYDNDKKKKKQLEEGHDENDNKIKNVDKMEIKFTYKHNNRVRLYKTTLKCLYDHNYLTLDNLFSIDRTINYKNYYDYNEIVNYIYYFNGLLQNRYQNINTLLYTSSNLLNSYNNDMKSLYIIGESQCGKSVFKNILLQYINEYYEKTNTKPADFNYDDSSILKVYDDIDLLEKSMNHKTYLILNKDTLTVNINEKNKQPVRVYKDITNIILNNDWPMITTWYHQRRIKTCLFIPISRKSLQYTVERIFKSETRGNGSFNDVFINNFFQYIISYKDQLYYDGVYYSDCKHLLDQNLTMEIISENIKNILNLDSIIRTREMVKVEDKKCITELRQVPYPTYIDYTVTKKFNIIL